ncbi:MAG: hypothetical protein GY866_34600 [Proteobacteria bacterium]|nr:hypothetical protein [Pseudomonadota bacterium]
MKKRLSVAILVVVLVLTPTVAVSHHVSMSFSNWELGKNEAEAVFRLPLADAVNLYKPELTIVEETIVRIKVPVDDGLRNSVREFLTQIIPLKVKMQGCGFDTSSGIVTFDKKTVQVRFQLSCSPRYLEDLTLENRFLVEVNRLHTTLATLNLPDSVRQCIFRYDQFFCGGRPETAAARTAPAWQARIAPWWDYAALGIVLLLLVGSVRDLLVSSTFFVLGNAFAPVALRLGLPVPSVEICLTSQSALLVYAGMLACPLVSGRGKIFWGIFISVHLLVLTSAFAGLLRIEPMMAIGLAVLGIGTLAFNSNRGEENSCSSQGTGMLCLLLLSFGLIHGFVLLGYRFQTGLFSRSGADRLAFFVVALVFGVVYLIGIRLGRFRMRTLVSRVLVFSGILVFVLRNVNMPFSIYKYETARDQLQNLVRMESPGTSFLAMALIMASIIGGLHAVTPGHGKTIIAAYLVGTKGRVFDAVILGMVVTLAHTFSVIVMAVIALFASKYILPDQLIPWISGFSGLAIAALGIFLFQLRLGNYLRYGTVTSIPEFPDSDIRNDHRRKSGRYQNHHHEIHRHPASKTISHSHDGLAHKHVLPRAGVGLWSLVTLGITGGIVPCPDALAILLIAVSINRILLGLAVVTAFSLGLALVLIAIGIAMVKFRPLMERLTGQGRLTTLWLPLLSAVLIAVLGAVLIWQAWY